MSRYLVSTWRGEPAVVDAGDGTGMREVVANCGVKRHAERIARALNAALDASGERETILDEARELVNGDRARDYAHPAVNFARIAQVWSVILGVNVTPRQVGLCMVGLKLAREVATPKRDNLVDAAGYLLAIEMADAAEAE